MACLFHGPLTPLVNQDLDGSNFPCPRLYFFASERQRFTPSHLLHCESDTLQGRLTIRRLTLHDHFRRRLTRIERGEKKLNPTTQIIFSFKISEAYFSVFLILCLGISKYEECESRLER